MNSPLVSVVIPVYNMESFLAETLDSVLRSTYSNFEIVLVNDGSTDNSLAVAQQYADRHQSIRIFSQANGGVSKARNTAVTHALGEYILPVDADNLISKDYIEACVKIFVERPAVKVVYCEAEFFGSKTGKWILPDFDLKLLARKNLIDNCAMYRRADWEKIGGYCEELLGCEDWDFWINMLKDGSQVYKLPMTGLYYRVRPNSLRKRTRHLKPELIATLNRRHKAFLFKQIGGKLYKSRTWSETYNKIKNIFHSTSIFSEKLYEDLVYHINDFWGNEKNTAFDKNISWQNETFRVVSTKDKNRLDQLSPKEKKSLVGMYQTKSIVGKYHIYLIFKQ